MNAVLWVSIAEGESLPSYLNRIHNLLESADAFAVLCRWGGQLIIVCDPLAHQEEALAELPFVEKIYPPISAGSCDGWPKGWPRQIKEHTCAVVAKYTNIQRVMKKVEELL